MTCECRCRFCHKKWESTDALDAPYWGVLYTICAVCYQNILEEFEKQFPRKAKVLRIEEKRR